MTYPVSLVVYATDTFNDFINKFNNVVSVIANSAITANSTQSNTTGNAYLNGTFAANTVAVIASIRGGNVSTSNTLVINSSFQSNSSLYVSNSGTYATVTATQNVDSFAVASFRSAKYIVQVSSSTGYQVSEILLLHDGTNSYLTEYATLLTASTQAVFTSNVVSGNCFLQVTPSQINTNVAFQRITTTVS